MLSVGSQRSYRTYADHSIVHCIYQALCIFSFYISFPLHTGGQPTCAQSCSFKIQQNQSLMESTFQSSDNNSLITRKLYPLVRCLLTTYRVQAMRLADDEDRALACPMTSLQSREGRRCDICLTVKFPELQAQFPVGGQ